MSSKPSTPNGVPLSESSSIEEIDEFVKQTCGGDPLVLSLWNQHKCDTEERIKQANDSSRIFHTQKKVVDPRMFIQFPHSPTANKYLQAFLHFQRGESLLKNYKRDTVKLSDCEYLKPAFACIAYGHIYENSLFVKPPENTLSLIDQYLLLKPDDILAEYVKVIIIFRRSMKKSTNPLSNYEQEKFCIRTAENFACKLQKMERKKHVSSDHQKVLIDLLYYLASRYVATNQSERALDCFKKCYDLDTSNYSALYGVAYMTRNIDTQKSIELFRKFIEMAPKCDKQFPNAHYMVASLFIKKQNVKEALRYCSSAEEAERIRLPFLDEVDIQQKPWVQALKETLPMEDD